MTKLPPGIRKLPCHAGSTGIAVEFVMDRQKDPHVGTVTEGSLLFGFPPGYTPARALAISAGPARRALGACRTAFAPGFVNFATRHAARHAGIVRPLPGADGGITTLLSG